MSPTVFYYKNYRFFFFSREEARIHVHVRSPDGEAKFWIEPRIELAVYKGIKERELIEIETIIRDKEDEIRNHWKEHFRSAGG
jgi:hypothetical protein